MEKHKIAQPDISVNMRSMEPIKQPNLFRRFMLIFTIEFLVGGLAKWTKNANFKCAYLSGWTYITGGTLGDAFKYYWKLKRYY